MPFQTDESWTPSTYRKALAAWQDNAPKTDGPIMPRDTAPTSRPRHDKLLAKLKSLMVWKHATEPDDPLATGWLRYDLHADNDNFDENDEPVPQLLDTEHEIQPSVPRMQREWLPEVWEKKAVIYNDVAVARFSPDGRDDDCRSTFAIPLFGDVDDGIQRDVPEYAASKIEGDKAPKRDRTIITRIRGLKFSNGEQTEKVLVRTGDDKVAYDDVRLPAGALTYYRQDKTWRRPSDRFRDAKGELPETEATVGIGNHNHGSLPCPDPIVDHEWARDIRKLVDKETARVLDMALEAANFRKIGEAFGKQGKHAERVGKHMVVDACGKLDAVLAANDNGYSRKDLAA